MEAVRVLIVEDDPVMAMHLEALVASALAAEVDVSSSVAEARTAWLARPDLVLLDVDVTDGTTYELAAQFVAHGVPCVFVSASDRTQVPATLGTVPFVSKPYADADIVTLLTAFARERRR